MTTYKPTDREVTAIQFDGRNGIACLNFAGLPSGHLVYVSHKCVLVRRTLNSAGTGYVSGLAEEIDPTMWLVKDGDEVYAMTDERFNKAFTEVETKPEQDEVPKELTQAGEFTAPVKKKRGPGRPRKASITS